MVIYKITNMISKKFYIGKDIKNRDNYYGSGIKIKDAIKSYGKEKFKKEIICECNDFNILNILEIFFINFYKSNDPKIGYNMTDGGEGGDLLSNHPRKKEIYEKIRLANTGKNHFTKRMTKKEYDNYILKKKSKNVGDTHYSKKYNKEEYKEYRKQQSLKSSGENNSHAKKIKVFSPNNKEYLYYGDFKKKITELNDGNEGLYGYLLKMLKDNSHAKKSKYKGWKAIYV